MGESSVDRCCDRAIGERIPPNRWFRNPPARAIVTSMRLLIAILVCAATVLAAGSVYSGNWASSQNDGSGSMRVQLKPEPQVSFTLGGQNVPTKIVKFAQNGDAFDVEYDFVIEGYHLRSHATGTIKGDKLQAKYETKSLEDGSTVDAGTMEAVAK